MTTREKRAFYVELGERLYRARIRRDMRQEDVAGALGISRPSWVNIEAGRQRLECFRLAQVARLLGTTTGRLLP